MMEMCRRELDFFGFNHYSRVYVQPVEDKQLKAETATPPVGVPVTAWSGQIDASALVEQLQDFADRFSDFRAPIYITKNDAAFEDIKNAESQVDDADRIAFFNQYLLVMIDGIDGGFDIRGLFFWSILDNLEWNAGYANRFGLVHVDFPTGERTPRASYHFMKSMIDRHGGDPVSSRPMLAENADCSFQLLEPDTPIQVGLVPPARRLG